MPRDDLSIDFVRRMPQPETVDPDQILGDFFYRFQNIPEEIRFINAEIGEKDKEVNTCLRAIEANDAKIQRWIKTNGSHAPNPREENLRNQIRENYIKAERFSDEKLALSQRLQEIYDRQLLFLDRQVKGLYDRAEPGFNDPDEVPSLLRASAANIPTPSFRTTTGSSNTRAAPSTPANAGRTSTAPALNKIATAQIRNTQAQKHAASAPATPAANVLNQSTRETSAGPGSGAPKRGPRAGAALGTTPSNPSGLARHSSLGPGPSKSASMTSAGSAVRAGSAGPRTSTAKGSTAGASRKGTPGATARKKPPPKSSLFRVKKASSKTSASAESDLSDAESASLSGDDKRGRSRGASGTPARDGSVTASIKVTEGTRGPGAHRRRVAQGNDTEMADAEDEEAGDDRKYCFCRTVSFGDMVACDNEDCPYEWFHWSCVGLKSEPNGKWFCAECSKKEKK